MNSLRCPRCGLSHVKKNGHTHYRKQNYRCLSCGRQFVRDSQRVSDDTRALVKRLLLERLSLRGVCRVTGLSLTWLLQFIAALYERLPDGLCVAPTPPRRPLHLLRLRAEVDELWSFVGRRADEQWLWPPTKRAARSSLSTSATAAGSRRANCGDASRRLTGSGPPSTATTGRRIRASSRPSGTLSAARSRDSPAEASDSTVRCGSGCRGWCGRRSRFPRSWRITSRRSSISSVTTTER